MNTIKFNHCYKKLLGANGVPVKEVTLLQVLEINERELTREFKDFDTDDGFYVIPKNQELLMLIFRKDKNNFLITLRKCSYEKLVYYSKAIGEVFKVEINEVIK